MCGLISLGLAGTPRPPLDFSVGLENGQFTVRWEERNGWQRSASIKRRYTVTYYPLSKKHNFIKVCRLICDHQTHTNNNDIGKKQYNYNSILFRWPNTVFKCLCLIHLNLS